MENLVLFRLMSSCIVVAKVSRQARPLPSLASGQSCHHPWGSSCNRPTSHTHAHAHTNPNCAASVARCQCSWQCCAVSAERRQEKPSAACVSGQQFSVLVGVGGATQTLVSTSLCPRPNSVDVVSVVVVCHTHTHHVGSWAGACLLVRHNGAIEEQAL